MRRWLATLIWRTFFLRRTRDIFSYWDGRKIQWADPLDIYRRFATHSTFDWISAPKRLDLPDEKIVLETSAQMADAVRDVFQLRSFHHGGLTEKECHQLFWQFLAYTSEVKKNSSPPPISPQSTESMEPADLEMIPPSFNTDCSSTSGESNSVVPTEPISPLPGHSEADPANPQSGPSPSMTSKPNT